MRRIRREEISSRIPSDRERKALLQVRDRIPPESPPAARERGAAVSRARDPAGRGRRAAKTERGGKGG